MATTTTTTNNNNNATLASRAAGLLSKPAAYAIAEKAMAQAIAAKRVYPALAEDFGAQLGVELPLKTKDFTRVVGHLLAASEKPLKGVISKRKSEILAVLADLVAALTDTPAIVLPSWALPKERAAKKAEEPAIVGALDRANAQAEANEAAEALAASALSEAKTDNTLAKAVAVVVANASALTPDQRQALLLALGYEAAEAEAAEVAEAEA
jgi:hypothetical protein